ncbi:hypothetical protein Fcan01_26866 [Folsomia candida]|uniref:Uncharacterized protein n=1 Tax=Folsomia candida TaxID=158441 RepID=A0A226D0F6_FOLCA|nr:hypothetical protein Fcan01_26866 [Folsomia candida]
MGRIQIGIRSTEENVRRLPRQILMPLGCVVGLKQDRKREGGFDFMGPYGRRDKKACDYGGTASVEKLCDETFPPRLNGWDKHEMINLSFVCAEWACEARKYIHQRDEDGRYFFLDSWLSSRLDNGAGPTVVALLPPALWPAVGPCISNVDASRRCFSKESAAKISKLVPDLEILVASVAFSKSWFKNGYSIHTVFDGSLQFLNVKELTLWVNGPCPFVEVRSQTYPGPESSYELTPEQEVSESETMLRAFPRLTVLSLDNHICPVLEAILSMLENAPPSLESIYLVVRSEWVTKKIVAQYPLLMQPHWIQIPITKILFVVFVGIEYPTFREDVFFFQVLLNHCSLTLEKLEITELTAHMDSPKVTIAFPKMPRLRKIKLVQMPWPPHICYRYFTPQVQDDDPAIQFPSLEE